MKIKGLVKNLCIFCESALLLFGLFFVSFHANTACAMTDGIESLVEFEATTLLKIIRQEENSFLME